MFNANVENEVLGSVGVDALTVSAVTFVGRAQLVAVFEQLAAISNYGTENWKGIGYIGYKVDGIIFGMRAGESIMIAKGQEAMRLYEAIERVEAINDVRVTRIDFCVDFRFERAWPTYLVEMRENKGLIEEAQRAKRELKLVSSMSGDTLYFGKRTSPRFGRIYDKSAYYDLKKGSVYRYEIETKKHVARAAIETVFPRDEFTGREWAAAKGQIRRIIRAQFLKWGVNVEWDNVRTTVLRAEMSITDNERRLQWLSRSVAPVITKLRTQGFEQQTFEALGLTHSGALDTSVEIG